MRRVMGLALLASVVLASAASASGLTPDATLRGRWEVEHVLPDLADQMHWEMRPDNPSLMYRELSLGADEVRFGDGEACKQTLDAAVDHVGRVVSQGLLTHAER